MSTDHDLSTAVWRKSSHSNGEGGACVEVAVNIPGAVPVRDSKLPDGPALVIPASDWGAFVTAVSNRAFPSC
ncbi:MULTISPECIES: DUF397 domain-containing protein [Streptomyces]|uniref:DUF397 domain-containing protein n=2 Tax=Streptomyces TaxID=1883 RepID=A0A3R7IUR8_9ACTN|nr:MULTISPECIES: DUF397 domain-containing protein [Streptomyces]KNE80475.1 hypothetical protein ADZ36_21725 [Streptomyces fradiae]OFA38063.1 DUF397 domain-containing protein [Streptomyces fradiae]PQM22450.1 DUF397 domain-containing protein [Streptomyces xinghaiensis]RKM96583.1 DUF397 domain-containing protein [Streptomyces xinghaiensis]RNC74265.1 DUF397 domain-containing protein [Streptomyces xinghaiensis]